MPSILLNKKEKPFFNKKSKAFLASNKTIENNLVKRLYYRGMEKLHIKEMKARQICNDELPRKYLVKTPGYPGKPNINYSNNNFSDYNNFIPDYNVLLNRNASCDNSSFINKMNKDFIKQNKNFSISKSYYIEEPIVNNKNKDKSYDKNNNKDNKGKVIKNDQNNYQNKDQSKVPLNEVEIMQYPDYKTPLKPTFMMSKSTKNFFTQKNNIKFQPCSNSNLNADPNRDVIDVKDANEAKDAKVVKFNMSKSSSNFFANKRNDNENNIHNENNIDNEIVNDFEDDIDKDYDNERKLLKTASHPRLINDEQRKLLRTANKPRLYLTIKKLHL